MAASSSISSVATGPPPPGDAFVIMAREEHGPIERVWLEVYQPVLAEFGFSPKRGDEGGRSILDQIQQLIQSSSLMIGDLSLERPNCYYEIGYAMGLDRHDTLILCCRDDHRRGSPTFQLSGHRVHFDLEAYPILWWTEDRLQEFASKLRERVAHRMRFINPKPVPPQSPSEAEYIMREQQPPRSGDTTTLDELAAKSREALREWKRKI